MIEPYDFEDFLLQYQVLIDKDPLRNILDVPPGDLEVQTIERPIRTIKQIIPEENMCDNLLILVVPILYILILVKHYHHVYKHVLDVIPLIGS